MTGGSCVLPFIREEIQKVFPMKVFVGDPWARTIYQDGLKTVLDGLGPRMAVSMVWHAEYCWLKWTGFDRYVIIHTYTYGNHRKINVLLVEDDSFLANIYKTKFEMEGFKISISENGEIALADVKKKNPP